MATIEDIIILPEGVRAELIDGKIYYHETPSTEHQEVVAELITIIRNYIKEKGNDCKAYIAPFAVYLQGDKNYVEPDISVICDRDKLDERGCDGAPDWIIEVMSPSNAYHDTVIKLELYINNGVREYWVVDPEYEKVIVYNEKGVTIYGFTKIKAGIYEDLEIDFSLISDSNKVDKRTIISVAELEKNLDEYLISAEKEDIYVEQQGRLIAKMTNPYQENYRKMEGKI